LVPPLQLTFVDAVRSSVGPLLLLTATVAVVVQLLLSVTITIYEPAGMELIESPLLTGVVFHWVEKGPVPPVITTDAVPLLLPQVAEVLAVTKFIAVGWLMVKFSVVKQPAPSVTVALKFPAIKLVADKPVAALLHVTVNGAVPAPIVAVAVPLFPPLQDTAVVAMLMVGLLVPVTTTFAVTEQLLASVAVTI